MSESRQISDLMAEALHNGSSLFREIDQLAIRVRIPEQQGLSADTAARVAAHNEKAAALRAACRQAIENLKLAVEHAGETDSIGDVMGNSESFRFERANLAEELVAVAKQRKEIIGDLVLPELRAIVPGLEEEAERIVSKVKTGLTKLGNGVEAQVAFLHGNLKAAQQQFDFLARQGNLGSKAALQAVKNAKAEADGSQTTLGASHQILNDARQLLLRVAMKTVAG